MKQDFPVYISLIFCLTTIITLLLFVWAVKNSKSEWTQRKGWLVFLILTSWLILQSIIALNNIYSPDPDVFPPKILLFGILPAMISILLLFVLKSGRQFIDSLPLKNLTFLHIVRIPVELVLFWLYLQKTIPELMTFAGRNFDILAGLTAPFVAYFGFTNIKIGNRTILFWNFICLALLANIVVNAFLSTPSAVQQFAFDQPNIAILFFPFSWLPTFVVPVVLFAHLTSIRSLLSNKTSL